LLLAIEPYLKDNIDDEIIVEKLDAANTVPIFLRNIYNFYTMEILGVQCVLLEIINEAPGINAIKKHLARIETVTNQKIVLYYKEITRYRRRSLIENNISFVVEDGQIFLPFLGLHLKKTKNYVEQEIKTFTPSAQIAYLYFLYNEKNVVNTTEFSKIFGFTLMTASRALNELYDTKLLTYEVGGKTGRSKKYRRVSNPDYFKRGTEFINSPIKKVVYVKKAPEASYVAGLEALSHLSMINPPNHKIRAIEEGCLNSSDLEIVKNKDLIKDEKLVELQIWGYDPKLFAKNNMIDVVSLYASLQGENDERIEQALEEVLRGEKWYMD